MGSSGGTPSIGGGQGFFPNMPQMDMSAFMPWDLGQFTGQGMTPMQGPGGGPLGMGGPGGAPAPAPPPARAPSIWNAQNQQTLNRVAQRGMVAPVGWAGRSGNGGGRNSR